MERKSLREEVEELLSRNGHPSDMPSWGQALCMVLGRHLAALEGDERPATEVVPELRPGDVIRLDGLSYTHHLMEPATLEGNWYALNLESLREVAIRTDHVAEVYRAGKLLWRLQDE